jgi:hypothetical protein
MAELFEEACQALEISPSNVAEISVTWKPGELPAATITRELEQEGLDGMVKVTSCYSLLPRETECK